MESLKAHLKTAVKFGEDIVDRHPTACLTRQMKELEIRYGGSRATWFLGFCTTSCVLVLQIGGLSLMASLVGFLYPACATFKAIDSPDAHAGAQWLSYWAIYGFFHILDTPPLSLVTVFIPFYSIIKMLFLVYCFHPSCQGASLTYNNLVSPLLRNYLPSASSGGRTRAARVPTMAPVASSRASGVAQSEMASTSRNAAVKTVPPMDDLRAPNELRVVVVSARNLVRSMDPAADVDCDPYCVLEVVPSGFRAKSGIAESTKYKTVCKTGTADPVWNESVIIPQVENLDAKLVVLVCNKRAMGRDQCLGKIEVSLDDPKILRPEGADMESNLSPAEGTEDVSVSGQLRVVVKLK